MVRNFRGLLALTESFAARKAVCLGFRGAPVHLEKVCGVREIGIWSFCSFGLCRELRKVRRESNDS